MDDCVVLVGDSCFIVVNGLTDDPIENDSVVERVDSVALGTIVDEDFVPITSSVEIDNEAVVIVDNLVPVTVDTLVSIGVVDVAIILGMLIP